jgi:hypothetical protein
MTGSETEVQADHSLPFGLLKKIVLEFLETGQMSHLVKWQEI